MQTVMPFGKYKGLSLRELPDDYLFWLLELPTLSPPLRHALEQEEDRRQPAAASAGPSMRLTPSTRLMAEELLTAGYRSLSKKYHPDCGGSTASMQNLNALLAMLKRALA